MSGIIFEEDSSEGYRNRTIKNASADATIAIATNFNTAGEKLTKEATLSQNKKYIPINRHDLTIQTARVDKLVKILNDNHASTLNIAGNGIYTLKGKYTQKQCDDFVFYLLDAVVNHPDLKQPITHIRTGGQTGFDEAGAKAGAKLGIPTLVYAPKGWRFRWVTGEDFSDEKLFKARFK